MDVVIDAASPIKKEILRWCQSSVAQQTEEEKAQGPTSAQLLQQQAIPSLLERLIQKWLPDTTMQGTVVLETNSRPYFDAIAEVLESRGLEVHDASVYDLAGIDADGHINEVSTGETSADSDEEQTTTSDSEKDVIDDPNKRHPPRIIIYPDGAATVNAFSAFARKRRQSSQIERTLVVVPDGESANLLTKELLTADLKPMVRVLCAAEAYDDLLGQVRVWARQGYSGEAIQRKLDIQLSYFYKLAARPSEHDDIATDDHDGDSRDKSLKRDSSPRLHRGDSLDDEVIEEMPGA
jgi:hypothetical protein